MSNQSLKQDYLNYLNGISGALKHPHILTKLYCVYE